MAGRKKAVVLGCTAKDVVSGFTGTVAVKHELLSGNVQWGLQPAMKRGATEHPKPRGFDQHTVEYVDAGHAARAQPVNDPGLHLGIEVKDSISGFVGIITEKTTFMNGCVYYGVQPRVSQSPEKSHELPENVLFEGRRLEKVGDGVSATAEAPTPKASGGPAIGDRRIGGSRDGGTHTRQRSGRRAIPRSHQWTGQRHQRRAERRHATEQT